MGQEPHRIVVSGAETIDHEIDTIPCLCFKLQGAGLVEGPV